MPIIISDKKETAVANNNSSLLANRISLPPTPVKYAAAQFIHSAYLAKFEASLKLFLSNQVILSLGYPNPCQTHAVRCIK